MWADAWGVRMEHILRNALLTLLEQPKANMADILRLFTDKTFLHNAIERVTNAQVKQFWKTEFENYNFRQRPEALAPIQNKLGAFLSDPRIYRIVADNGFHPSALHYGRRQNAFDQFGERKNRRR